MIQVLVAAAVYLALVALAFLRPAAGRRAMGLFFAVMAVGVNGAVTLFAPHLFVDLAAAAPWGWYRAIAMTLTEPSPRIFGTVMVLGELTVAGLVLAHGRATRLGLLGAALFALGITPLGAATLANPLLAVAALRLASIPWPASAFTRADCGPVAERAEARRGHDVG
jgi:hypothetical protein